MNSPGNNNLGILEEDPRQSFLETELKLLLAIQKATVLVLFSTNSVSIKLLDIQNASRALQYIGNKRG